MATSRRPAFDVQSVSDFFKSATRNMLFTVWTVRLIAIVMLVLLVNSILNVLLADVGQISNLTTLIDFIVLLFFVIILAVLTLTGYVMSGIAGLFQLGETTVSHYVLSIRAFVIEGIFGDVNLLPGFDSETFYGSSSDAFSPLAYLLNKPQKEIYNPIITQGLLLLGVVLIIITGIGFIRRSDVKLAGITLVISQLVIGFAYLKEYTTPLSLDNSTISSMLGSSMYQLALISYLYFEFSLQTGYLYDLTSPTLTRQKRVGKQLERLSEFRLGITKLGTEEEKESEEAKRQLEKEKAEEEGEERTSSALAAGSGSTSAKKYSSEALLFLLDSASDSLFAKPGGEQERLTGRLQRYHDGLLQHDPRLDDKLGGSAEKAFNPIIVLATVMLSLALRVVMLIFLSWLVVKPDTLLRFIALPESITNSLEITQPEGLLIVLIPVVFLILGVSYLFARFQEWVVKAEELIIEESDINKIIQEGKAITSREEAEQRQAEAALQQENIPITADKTERRKRRRRKRKSKKN